METFADWLRYYNNLDVKPGLEALEKTARFYTEKGLDIFKDAVSISGVSLTYLLSGAVDRGAKPYAPSLKAYSMLKEAVVGGPSLVFTRYHEKDKTKIRDHKIPDAKFCKNILGYDANALYLSTMAKDMPCGKELVRTFENSVEAARYLTQKIKNNEWFGLAEVDIRIPQELHGKFEEMCPFFLNKEVPEEAVPKSMLDYLKETGRSRIKSKKPLGCLYAEKILLHEPLFKWYLDRGAQITAVYGTIEYKRQKVFGWFVDEVTKARRSGDKEKSKALLADIFKPLGNSGYGKLIEALERQTNITYTRDEKVVDRAMRSCFFQDLEEVGETYEIERRKARINIKRPFQVGIAVYQLAKPRMLEFYYDFLDKYFSREDFELIQMDTDNNYLAISAEKLTKRQKTKEGFCQMEFRWSSP